MSGHGDQITAAVRSAFPLVSVAHDQPFSDCIFLVLVGPGSPCCDRMPSGAKLITVTPQDHSHTLLASHSDGVASPAQTEKWKEYTVPLAEVCRSFFGLHAVHLPSFFAALTVA